MERVEHFPDWAALLISPATAEEAAESFKTMARMNATPTDDYPVLAARNPHSRNGGVYRVRFTLTGPQSDDDHFLYKADEDTTGRSHAGEKRIEDYKADRAQRILFIPPTLKEPDFVYYTSEQKLRIVYVSRVAPDEYFAAFVDSHPKRDPRYTFVTAYPMTEAQLNKKRKSWIKIYPSKGAKRKG